jgi:4-hydroxy-2-oxoglutarate aldolase
MTDTRNQLSGVFVPITTPFRDDNVDVKSLAQNVERMSSTGLRGYFVLGTNGEYKSLSTEERWEVLRTVVRYRGKDQTIMAGCGAESTHETLELVQRAVDLGTGMVSLLMPSFFAKRITEEVMEGYAREVADFSPVPVVLYNNPSVANGVIIKKSLLNKLADHDNIVGIKDSSRETWKDNLTVASDRFFVLAGSASYFYELLSMGGIGGIVSLANVIPEVCVRLYQAFIGRKKEVADELNERIVELNRQISGSFGVAGVKAAMDQTGFVGGLPRRPLIGLNSEDVGMIVSAIEDSGLL